MVSAPPRPSIRLLPSLPVIRLASALPVPLSGALPVSTRFSRLGPSVQLRLALTVSVPAFASSLTASPASSTQ